MSLSVSSPIPMRYRRRAWRLSGIVCLWGAANTYAFYGFLPSFVFDRHEGFVPIALIAAAPGVGSLVLLPIAYQIVRRVGRTPVLVGGLMLWSVSGLLLCFASNLSWILLCRVCAGCAVLLDLTIVSLVDAAASPQHRSSVLTRLALLGWVGIGLGIVIASVAEVSVNWRLISSIFSLPGPFLALMALRLPEPRTGANSVTLTAIRERLLALMTHKKLLVITLAHGTQSGTILSSLVFAPALLAVHGKMPVSLLASRLPLLLFALFVGAALSVVLQRVIDRWLRKDEGILLAGGAMIVSGISLFGGITSVVIGTRFVLLCVSMASLGMVGAPLLAIFATLVSVTVRPTGYAVYMLLTTMVSSSIPIVIAIVAVQARDLHIGMLLFGILPVIIAGSVLVWMFDFHRAKIV